MQSPSSSLRPISPPTSVSSRAVSIVLAAVLNVGIVIALLIGLGTDAVKQIIRNIDVAVIEPPPDETKPPPPPPPVEREPPPFVPPPDITIDVPTTSAPTNAITMQSERPTPAPTPSVNCVPSALNSHAVTERDYPQLSIRNTEEGRVGVRYLIDTQGNVADVQIVKPSGKFRLDQAAIPLVKRWRFKWPACSPQPVWVQVNVDFRLR